MENNIEIGLLLDFYGQLLTARQQEILDLHYNNDYSLGEIAETLGISRQGVHDNVKRGKAVLNDMEQKLRLVSKFLAQKHKAEAVLTNIQSINAEKLDSKDKARLAQIQDDVNFIINNF